jgi:hypothetical protein
MSYVDALGDWRRGERAGGLGGERMTDKPFHQWTKDELVQKERAHPLGGEEYGDQIRSEIERRSAMRHERYLLLSVIVAAVSALGSMIAAIATLIALYAMS